MSQLRWITDSGKEVAGARVAVELPQGSTVVNAVPTLVLWLVLAIVVGYFAGRTVSLGRPDQE